MKPHHWFLLFLSFFLIAALIYSPSLGGPFQYDDYAQILDNKVLTGRNLPTLLSSIFRFTAHPDGWTGTRDFVRATFLLNWQWWGEKPLGYRWVNLTIHVINATLVSVLVSNLLSVFSSRLSVSSQSVFGQSVKTGKLKTDKLESENRKPKTDNWIAIGSGLLFLVHPLNSQAVAYVAQRFTSVATLFYLLTIIFYIIYNNYKNYNYNGYNRYKSYIIYGAAILAALLAYNSKEIAVTLPVALLLVSFAGPREEGKGKRVKGYFLLPSSFFLLPFLLLALKIPFQIATAASAGIPISPSGPSNSSNPSSPLRIDLDAFALKQKEDLLSRRDYFLTQINVVGTYLRLAVLPVNQTLDYDYPVTRNLDPKTIALAALHLGLVGLGSWLLFGYRFSVVGYQFIVNRFSVNRSQTERLTTDKLVTENRKPKTDNWTLVGLGILWFYLTLLPESSIIPIPDVIYEHRAYLPLVGLVVALAGAASAYKSYKTYRSYRTYIAAAAILWLLLLSAATLRRASVWGNEVRLWHDVYAKAPQKPRAVKNYGVILAAAGKYDRGIELLEKAVVLDPDNADYWSNLGTANLRAGRYDAAKDKFLRAYTLLAAELDLPPYEGLRPSDPSDPSDPSLSSLRGLPEKSRRQAAQYLNDYGVCLVQLNREEEALAAFQKSLAIDPTLYAARLGLGAAYNLQNDIQAATDVFESLVEEYPDLPDAYNNLAVMYKKAGRLDDHDRILRATPKSPRSP